MAIRPEWRRLIRPASEVYADMSTTHTPTDAAPDGREVIAVVRDAIGKVPMGFVSERDAVEFVGYLAKAGYRIVPAADPETVTLSIDAAKIAQVSIRDRIALSGSYVPIVRALREIDAALRQREGGE